MTRKVIIDCDPGIDDAVALTMALFDPRLDVQAITACSGTVEAERSTQNVQAIVERLDPPRHPRIGQACDPDNAAFGDGRAMHGADGLGNCGLEPIGRQHVMPSEKLIADRIRANPGQISILCLGPLTGIARAFQRDPSLVSMVDRIVMTGGSYEAIGDVTPAAEFNMHFDPAGAAAVFRSATTKTLVPLELSSQLSFGLSLLDVLPPRYSRAGALLHQMIPHLFRAFRQERGQESIHMQAVVGLLMLTEPSLFESSERYAEVEQSGLLTRGATLFDRRSYGQKPQSNMEVAMSMDIESARDCAINAIRYAGQNSGGV